MELISAAFATGQPIPRRHSCEGEDLSPPLAWSGVPADAVSLASLSMTPTRRSAHSRIGLHGVSAHTLAVSLRASAHLARAETTFARSAIGDRARRAAMGCTVISSACMRWRGNQLCGLARAGRTLSARSGEAPLRGQSLSARTSDDRHLARSGRVISTALVGATARWRSSRTAGRAVSGTPEFG